LPPPLLVIAGHCAPGIIWKFRFNRRCIFERRITVPVAAS